MVPLMRSWVSLQACWAEDYWRPASLSLHTKDCWRRSIFFMSSTSSEGVLSCTDTDSGRRTGDLAQE